MPFIKDRFYMNPAYGRSLENARGSAATSEHDNPQEEEMGDHWVTIDERHVLIQEKPEGEPQRSPKQYIGDATYYNLPGKKTASGAEFDPNKMAAAMTAEKAKLGQNVTVTYTSKDKQGNTVTRSISVAVNDRGPFARDANGKAKTPLQPDAAGIIDLTPAAFKKLIGTTKPGRVPVTVTVPNE